MRWQIVPELRISIVNARIPGMTPHSMLPK